MTHRLATNYAKNYCNRTPIVKVIVENVVTCFLGHSVEEKVSAAAAAGVETEQSPLSVTEWSMESVLF